MANKSMITKFTIGISILVFCGFCFAEQIGFSTQNGGTTGGTGGLTVYATTGSEINAFICNRETNNTPIIIHVEGTINHSNTSMISGSCNTRSDQIELNGVSNISIIGVGKGALFDQLGIHLSRASNIILQNLHIRNVKKSGSSLSNGGDAISLENKVSNVWLDHLTLEASGGESDGYDSLVDMKNDSTYVTVSYTIFRNSGRGGLVGSTATDNNNGPVTFHHNLYKNIDSRVPLMRGRLAHSYNNYFNGINKSGINVRAGGKMLVENNYFENAKNPLGTFYTKNIGYWQVNGNEWNDSTWSDEVDEKHPAGSSKTKPLSTASVNVPYDYNLDAAQCVPDIVKTTAGANKGIIFSNGECTEATEAGDPNVR